MNDSIVQQVWLRAGRRCEYCRMPQAHDEAPFEIDHIIAKKHGGLTRDDNLALSCAPCNLHKGSDIASLDPISRKLTPLFHPRRQKWLQHFRWKGATLVGLTAAGRVTISILKINDPYRVTMRAELIRDGEFPDA